MSRLLGPFSVISSSVSLRDAASAENTAGMPSALPAATAAVDLRKSRRFIPPLRFIENLRCPKMSWGGFRKARAKRAGAFGIRLAV